MSNLPCTVSEDKEPMEEQSGNISNDADFESLYKEIFAIEESEETVQTNGRQNHRQLWKKIVTESAERRRALEVYNKSKQKIITVPTNPYIEYLNQTVFPLLFQTLEETLLKARDLECLKHQKSTFNGLDYISETLWNINMNHPERHKKQTYIFDMDWVKEWLKENPRPYFPFSYVWSKNFAATKIQAGWRGYCIRKTGAVQEMRQFWKVLENEKQLALNEEQ